nr:hypothetical protein [Tanacetum cinerariifolium]GFA30275.1 hypothetical protein [Tanacetum cinerariifolium]
YSDGGGGGGLLVEAAADGWERQLAVHGGSYHLCVLEKDEKTLMSSQLTVKR